MTNPYDLESLFERLATGSATESDIQFLRRSISRSNDQNVIRVGNKYDVNIGQASGSIHIGDNITYQGENAREIREILRLLQNVQRQQPLVSDSEVLRRLRQRQPLRETSSIPFQGQVLVSWVVVSLVCAVALFFSQPSTTPYITSVAEFIYVWLGLFFALTVYAVFGIILQAAHQYRWRLGEVRHHWIVWVIYPLIAPFGVALWMLFYSVKYGDRILNRFFRFW
jgi:Effector-associated domain 10